jgi:hypothetical protein
MSICFAASPIKATSIVSRFLARCIVDLRWRANRTGRLGGTGASLKRRAEQEGRQDAKSEIRPIKDAIPIVLVTF